MHFLGILIFKILNKFETINNLLAGLPLTGVFMDSVADQGSGAFLTPDPGSGIGFFRIPDLGSQNNIFESLMILAKMFYNSL
jgi:hypothetical protein